MHREVLCILTVFLGVGWASAQQPPGCAPYANYPPGSYYAPYPYYQGYPQAGPAGYGPLPSQVVPAGSPAWGNGYSGNSTAGYWTQAPAGPAQPASPKARAPRMSYADEDSGSDEPKPQRLRTLKPAAAKAPAARTAPRKAASAPAKAKAKASSTAAAGKTGAARDEIKQASYTAPATVSASNYGGVYQPNYGYPAFAACPGAACGPPPPYSNGASYVDEGGYGPNPIIPPCECMWFSASARLAWFRPGAQSAPLVTTGSPAALSPGALNQSDSSVIFGGRNLDYGMSQGVELAAGVFLDPEKHFSLDFAALYYLPEHIKAQFVADSMGNPVIARPVINGATGVEESFLTSLPGSLTGSTKIDATTNMFGFEMSGRCNAQYDEFTHVDILGGFRFLRLKESLSIQDRISPLSDGFISFRGFPVLAGSVISDQDRFASSNEFYGLNLGVRYRWCHDWVSLSLYGKAAVGVIDEEVTIQGKTTLVSATMVDRASGGILALPSNIGNYNRSVFAVVPEGGVTVGMDPIKHVRITAGYSFLFWNRVMRPGNQIDRTVNPALVPTDQQFGLATDGSSHPAFSWRDEAFWVHNLNLGLELLY